MKMTILPAFAAACAFTFAGPVYAQHGHGSQPHTKIPTTHVQGGAAAAHGGGQAHGAPAHGGATHGASTHATSTHGASTHATAPHGGGSHADKAPKTSPHGSNTTTASTSTRTTTTTPGTQLTPLQQKLQKNTNLAAKLQSRLPAGATVQQACLGFRNLGQFVAAVNVSNNLGIPFAQLKAKMTGDSAMSLGQAIHALRPTVDADAESRTAQRQADAMVAGGR